MIEMADMAANGHAEVVSRQDQLSVRARNVLKNEGFMDDDGAVDVAALRALDDDQLKRLPNLGKRTFDELRNAFGGHVPPPPPSLQERRLLFEIERAVERIQGSIRENRGCAAIAVADPLARQWQRLTEIALACNSINAAMGSVMKKAALALSDFTDVDLLAELQRRSQVRQEEARQKPPDPTKATIDAILKD
jgi:hypothetical protein